MIDTQGRFVAGPDPDRHALNRAERHKGYVNAMNRLSTGPAGWEGMAWLFYSVRRYYRARRRAGPVPE